MADDMEEKVHSALLAFVDFMYAIVFGLIMANLFEDVLTASNVGVEDKVARTLLIVGVFYFLAWDWMHGRILTLRNPYRGFFRFYLEVIIAFCGYGAARSVVRGRVSFFLYIILILFLGARWAWAAQREHPESSDGHEFQHIKYYQPFWAIVLTIISTIWYQAYGSEMNLFTSSAFILLGFVFIFIYEIFIERSPGVLGGPGVPFIGRRRMKKARLFVEPLLTRIANWRK